MSEKERYVTSEYLDALLGSVWELLARLIWVISLPVAFSQTILWWNGISMRPQFTLTCAIVGWIGFVSGLVWWLAIWRRRKRILKRGW